MSVISFRGDAPLAAQVSTTQVTAYDASTTYSLTRNGKSVSTIAAGDAADTASTLASLWNASTEPEHAEISAAANSDVITLTHDTSGIPFTVVEDADGGTGTMSATSETTAASGPNIVQEANFRNVATGANLLPSGSSADALIFEDTAISLLWSLGALSAVQLAELIIKASYTGDIGLPNLNSSSLGVYDEPRERWFLMPTDVLEIGEGGGRGMQLCNLDVGSSDMAATVFSSGRSNSNNYHAIRLKGGTASSTLTVRGGSVDVAPFDNTSATFATVSAINNGVVRCSDNVTITNVNGFDKSSIQTNSAHTNALFYGSSRFRHGAGDIGTLRIEGTSAELQAPITVSTLLYIGAGRTLDLSKVTGNVTSTNQIQMGRGASIFDPNGKLVSSNGALLLGSGLHEVRWQTKQNAVVTVT